jgi:nicotinamide-nucleotide amidase
MATPKFEQWLMDSDFYPLAEKLGQLLRLQNAMCATAESCTGGWISQVLTEVPGSSTWFERGFVTYSNAAKCDMLGVKLETLASYGAVSEQTAVEMALGALAHSTATCSVAVTGIAGPDGGSVEKPVGTVFIAWAVQNQSVQIAHKIFAGSRQHIRAQTVQAALEGLILAMSAR